MAPRLSLAFLLIAGTSRLGAIAEDVQPTQSSLRGAQSAESSAVEPAEATEGARGGEVQSNGGVGVLPEGWAGPREEEAAEGKSVPTSATEASSVSSESLGSLLNNSTVANATLGLATGQPACLCVFDIDRTLTGRQGNTQRCPQNRPTDMWDSAYGGGHATLSALSNAGIRTTFCDGCVLGICSAGHGSGSSSPWNNYLLNEVMRGAVHDTFMLKNPIGFKQWSQGTNVISPFVLGQSNRQKQDAVELVRKWYEQQGLQIPPQEVYFFGDRTENIAPFHYRGLNSREVSCGTRDQQGRIGYCGASPAEIVKARGNYLCR
mmetsp:Transcript_45166/g.96871  ORF Transcript_45166/g.96871 Transcript_45166/m.96871 type:complete len:320 (-) Transcript_45166:445-1404(-)